jgi:DEAD/DEAH box helicase domain-containing protein
VSGTPDPPLSANVKSAIKSARGIEGLYTHQVQAIDALADQRHVIVSTSTASGKSVIYQVPLLDDSLFHSSEAYKIIQGPSLEILAGRS